ncbi:hypothetical protein VV869_18530 [Photobacterium sp. MCCC 1A19761]|uniref:hypothetical protein n=1 Tax=Photobacterium sp. MCCC 1A19761 TaxID=3115000 RepID=UPI00307FA4F4
MQPIALFHKLFLITCAILFSGQTLAKIVPTSTTELSQQSCRLDLYHLTKNEQQQFESNLQLALITENPLRQRYIALKTASSHRSGFENIGYYRSGQPVEIFTANWRKYKNQYSVSRLVVLGGTSDKQAFDVFTRLLKQDQGHIELKASNLSYRFTVRQQDLSDFQACIDQHYHK